MAKKLKRLFDHSLDTNNKTVVDCKVLAFAFASATNFTQIVQILQKQLTNILIVAILFFSGFASKTAIENKLIADFFAIHSTNIVVGAVVFLFGIGVLILIGFLLVQQFLKRKLDIDADMLDVEMVTGLVDLFTTPEGIRNPSSQERRRAAVVNAGLWWTRRGATQFYAWLLVTIMGGLIGAATLFLLHEQNKKLEDQNGLFGIQNKLLVTQSDLLREQNTQIKLQTQANIANSILLEGARRAALSQEMSNLFEYIRKEVTDIKAMAESNTCSHELLGKEEFCRVSRTRELVAGESQPYYEYFLSDPLLKRVKSFADQSTPYHLARFNGGKLAMNKPLEDQFKFVELSPERGFLLKELLQNGVSAGYLNLERADLGGAVLRNGDLSKLNLELANLAKASLFKVNLTQTNLVKANLVNVYMSDVILAGAHLQGAILKDAELQNANLSGADLSNANLKGVGTHEADFENANLAGANLSAASLLSANFSNANLDKAILKRANLSWAKLPGANLEKTKLNGANLSMANLENAYLEAAILIEANLEGANLNGANLVGANLTGANLKAANLTGAHLSSATFSFAKLSSNSNLSGAWAWSDYLPRASRKLLEKIQICKFDPKMQNQREKKPEPCVKE